jgi:hypothetical protein
MEAREEDEWFFIKWKDLTPIKFLSLQNHQILKEIFPKCIRVCPSTEDQIYSGLHPCSFSQNRIVEGSH